MWDPKASMAEKEAMENYMKYKIRETFELFQSERKGYVDKKYATALPPEKSRTSCVTWASSRARRR